SIGAVTVPIGTIIALVTRLARGPRLIGGLHLERSEGQLGAPESVMATLTAQIVGSSDQNSWQVTRPLAAVNGSASPQPAIRDMIEELALRIYTDLALARSTKWNATKSFS